MIAIALAAGLVALAVFLTSNPSFRYALLSSTMQQQPVLRSRLSSRRRAGNHGKLYRNSIRRKLHAERIASAAHLSGHAAQYRSSPKELPW